VVSIWESDGDHPDEHVSNMKLRLFCGSVLED